MKNQELSDMGFYIQDDMYESLSDLPEKDQDKLLGAMTRFYFTGEEPQFSGIKKALFTAFRQRINMSRSNAERQKRCRDKKRDSNANSNRDKNRSPLFRDGEGEIIEDTNVSSYTPYIPQRDSSAEEAASFIAEALRIFNAETGQSVMDLTVSTMESLRRIHGNGRTPEDLRKVVSLKAEQWASDKRMRKYIRPSTLYGDKFEEYLGEAEGVSKRASKFAKYD